MTNEEFAEVLKDINKDLQAIKIYNLFNTTEMRQDKAIQDKQKLIHKIAQIRKNLLTNKL